MINRLLTFALLALPILAHAQPFSLSDRAFLSAATFDPAGVSSSIRAWWEARLVTANDGDAIASWSDASGHGFTLAQATGANKPIYKSNQAGGVRPVLRFDGTNQFVTTTATIIATNITNWTVSWVARGTNPAHNNTVFDITEQTGTQSVLARNIFLNSSYSIQSQIRDAASHINTAQYPGDLSGWVVGTSTRNGDTVKLRINGSWVSTNSASAIGAVDSGTYNTTIGAVKNSIGLANYLEGDVYGVTVYTSTLSDAQIQMLERYWTYQTTIPTVSLARNAANPVIPFGLVLTADAGRILEPTVMLDGATWKIWYSGLTNNGGGLNQGWQVLYATSADGIAWTKQGVVKTNAWEPDVVKVSSTYYMAHVLDTAYNVRLSSSANGTTWTDHGEIINLTDSVWSNIGPREPNLYYESGTYYCFYGDASTSDGRYRIGLSTCSGDPTVHANWACQATPVFSPTITAPRWNQGGDTESPCVRKYPSLIHPYVMSFIGYNNLAVVTNKPWRVGFAYADSPSGPWTEGRYSTELTIDTNGTWDDRIAGEATHLETGGTIYVYYAGGKVNGANQVGLATISLTDFQKWFLW